MKQSQHPPKWFDLITKERIDRLRLYTITDLANALGIEPHYRQKIRSAFRVRDIEHKKGRVIMNGVYYITWKGADILQLQDEWKAYLNNKQRRKADGRNKHE